MDITQSETHIMNIKFKHNKENDTVEISRTEFMLGFAQRVERMVKAKEVYHQAYHRACQENEEEMYHGWVDIDKLEGVARRRAEMMDMILELLVKYGYQDVDDTHAYLTTEDFARNGMTQEDYGSIHEGYLFYQSEEDKKAEAERIANEPPIYDEDGSQAYAEYLERKAEEATWNDPYYNY